MGMTLRENFEAVYDLLVEKCDDLGLEANQIQKAKYGDMPEKAPCILIYAGMLPDKHKVNRTTSNGIGKIYLFCCESNKDHIEAMLKSNELAEKVSILLVANNLAPIDMALDFDSVYSNIAVSVIEFTFKYFYSYPETV